MSRIAATGFASGASPSPDLAATAVKEALAAAGSNYAHSVILLLSDFAPRHVQPALSAAARVAGCLQLAGCTASGVFTEWAWSLNQPAAAALVLTGPISLGPARPDAPCLTLALPEAAKPAWIGDGSTRCGTLASVHGPGKGSVWTQGKLAASGRCEASFRQARVQIGVSRGMRMISAPLDITDQDGHDLFQLAHQPALRTLLNALPHTGQDWRKLPLHLLFAAALEPELDPADAIREGNYTLLPILGVNVQENSVTLGAALPPDMLMCWALRDPAAAERDMMSMLDGLASQARPEPAFALMFSCIGRGPYFYQGQDRDLFALQQCYPGLPVIGSYGAGEIGPLGKGNTLFSYSAVVALASPDGAG